MNILVSLGPIIGAVIIVLYITFLRLSYYLKGIKISKKQQQAAHRSDIKVNLISKVASKREKIIYYILIVAEIFLILNRFMLPKVTGRDYLLNGMSTGTKYVISDSAFKVSYKQAKRGYYNRIYLRQKDLDNLGVECSVEQGKALLTIQQDDIKKEVDITNVKSLLDMTDFVEGEISFTLTNEDARNLKFELIW